jgi:hypothetical protein
MWRWRFTETPYNCLSRLERLRRPGLFNLRAAILAGPARVVVPEIEHRLAERLHDVGAIEADVFDQGLAILAVEDDVFFFPGRSASFLRKAASR